MINSLLKGLKYALHSNKTIILLQWFFNAVHNLSPLLFAIIWAQLIDTAIQGIQEDNLSFSMLIVPFLLYIVVEVGKSLAGKADDALQAIVFDTLELKVHSDIIGKYSSLDIQSLEDSKVNRLFQIIRESYDWQVRHLVFTIGRLLSAFLILSTSSYILFKISPIVLLIIIVSSIPYVLAKIKLGSVDWGIWNADADKFRKFNLTRDFLLDKNNLIEASINNVSPYLVNVIRNVFKSYHGKRIPIIRKGFLVMFFTDLVKIAGSVYSVYFLINLALNNSISVGELILASSIFLAFAGALGTFLYELTEAYNSGYFMRDFMSFLSLENKIKKGSIQVEKFKTPPTIEFRNVSFKYPNTKTEVLKNINLKIEPGMKVALVGENGVGKTTLIKILSRFYDLTSGKIYINGIDLADIETESWEANLGLLTQHFNTYPAFSAQENIYFGDVSQRMDKKKVIEAAQKAKADSFIEKYENKYDQILSIQFKEGIDPSWGQWQRLGIARTLYRDSPIIILDEPTSAIDAQAEHEIFENINRQTKDKTVIYVSHRYSTVKDADLICVLKNGSIIESGTHRYLMSINGEYANNFNLQAKNYLGD